MLIPKLYSDSIDEAKQYIEQQNNILIDLIKNTSSEFLPIKVMKNADVSLSEFREMLYKFIMNYNDKTLVSNEAKDKFKEDNKELYDKYRSVKDSITNLVKNIEDTKKDFIQNDKDKAHINMNILNIKELAQNSFLGDSDVINEIFENSLLVRGLFSSDTGALIFLNMNII